MMASQVRSTENTKPEVNEDILTLILVVLPPKSIFRFRCVSKLWNNLISSPYFLQCYRRKPKNLLGFVTYPSGGSGARIVTLDNHDHEPAVSSSVLRSFVNSSNGLMLGSILYKNNLDYEYQYIVMNQLTGKIVALPDLPLLRSRYYNHLALVCEENQQELVASYKVVVAFWKTVDKTLSLQTYSSETSKWTISTVTTVEDVMFSARAGFPVVVNGIVHWLAVNLDYDHRLVVYDSNTAHLQLIHLPYNSWWRMVNLARSGDDDLWLGAKINESITFWMLPKGSSATSTNQWILKYSFSIDSMGKDIISAAEKENIKMVPSSVDRIVIKIQAFIPSKPHVIFICIQERIFLYNNIASKLEVPYQGIPIDCSLPCWPYLEPMCLSSYAL